jgi:hypothetical protein
VAPSTPNGPLLSLAALAGLLALAGGCSRSALNADCPNGYTTGDAGVCVCATDEGCPTGHRCEQSVCVCRDTSCCPAGYQYSQVSQLCVCQASECCPKDHVWLEAQQKCTCGAQDCCPDGYTFSQATQSCQCTADLCCPVGFTFDTQKQLCTCDADGCCPVDYRFDPISKDCVCAKTSCCPANYVYDDAVAACVCVGSACCPSGFVKGTANRCVCVNDASCGPNQHCDPVSGGCKCADNSGCAANTFCNSDGYCQSFASCTSDLDCPGGYFCDTTTSRCLANGPCTLDSSCAFGDICSTSTQQCVIGCRIDGDCPTKLSCVNGSCQFFCRDNTFCPAGQFCDLTSGSCATSPGRVDCQSCGGLNSCGPADLASCLTFVEEGQTTSFCGMMCSTAADCPSGYDCGGVIFGCSGAASCAQVTGDSISCRGFQVVNETGTQFYCADSTGQPHEYFKACAPSSGSCPAVASP